MIRIQEIKSGKLCKFLSPAPAEIMYENFCKAENEFFNVVNYKKIEKNRRTKKTKVRI